MPRVEPDQILQGTVVLHFLVATDGKHIGLVTSATGDGHTPTSALQPSLDPGLTRSDLSNVITITKCQCDTLLRNAAKRLESRYLTCSRTHCNTGKGGGSKNSGPKAVGTNET